MKSVFRLLSCISKAMDRKYVVALLKQAHLDDDVDKVQEIVEDLVEKYKTKLAPKLTALSLDVDEYVRGKYISGKLEGLGIDVEEMLEKKNNILSKMGVEKMKDLNIDLDEVERISQLKDELMLKELDEMIDHQKEMAEKQAELREKMDLIVEKLNKGYLQHKKDYRSAFEKSMITSRDKIDEAVKAQIEEHAIRKFKQSIQSTSLKGGIKLGRRH